MITVHLLQVTSLLHCLAGRLARVEEGREGEDMVEGGRQVAEGKRDRLQEQMLEAHSLRR